MVAVSSNVLQALLYDRCCDREEHCNWQDKHIGNRGQKLTLYDAHTGELSLLLLNCSLAMCQTCVKWQAGSSSNRVVSAIKPVHRPYSTSMQQLV